MSKYFITLIVLAATITLWVQDVETYLQKKAFRTTHYALEHAIHDAGLQIVDEEISNGIIDYDETKGHEAFMSTLARNLPINEDLTPKHNLFYETPISILDAKYIDDTTLDPNTGNPIVFPYVYEYKNSTKNIEFERTIFGPSVVYVIETTIFHEDSPTQFVNIQEYKK